MDNNQNMIYQEIMKEIREKFPRKIMMKFTLNVKHREFRPKFAVKSQQKNIENFGDLYHVNPTEKIHVDIHARFPPGFSYEFRCTSRIDIQAEYLSYNPSGNVDGIPDRFCGNPGWISR